MLESILVASPGETIELDDLPPSIARAVAPPRSPITAPGTTLESMERELIKATLESAGGNRTHSAELLGIGVRTLQRKIRTYGLDIASKRRRPRPRP